MTQSKLSSMTLYILVFLSLCVCVCVDIASARRQLVAKDENLELELSYIQIRSVVSSSSLSVHKERRHLGELPNINTNDSSSRQNHAGRQRRMNSRSFYCAQALLHQKQIFRMFRVELLLSFFLSFSFCSCWDGHQRAMMMTISWPDVATANRTMAPLRQCHIFIFQLLFLPSFLPFSSPPPLRSVHVAPRGHQQKCAFPRPRPKIPDEASSSVAQQKYTPHAVTACDLFRP